MKKILCLVALLFAGLSLASCDFNSDGGSKITVTFWHAMGQANQVVIDQMIASFEAKYPNIHVEQYSQGGYTDLRDKILTSIPVGEGPTIAQAYPDHIAAYLNAKAVKELDSYVNSSTQDTGLLNSTIADTVGISATEQAQYIKAFADEGRVYDEAGTLYCMPFNKSTEVLYYNLDFFKRHQADLATFGVAADGSWSNPTWEQVEGIATYFKTTAEYNAITDKTKAAGFAADSEANLFITLTQQWGGQYTGFVNGEGKYLFNNPQSKEAISWFNGNYQSGVFGTSTKFVTAYSSTAFTSGQCIMSLGSSAGAGYNVPADGSFEVGVTTYPQRANGLNKQVIQQGTNVVLFKNDNAAVELAGWLFIKHITNFENALLWCKNTAYFPIRQDVYDSTDFQNKIADGTVASKAQVVGWSQKEIFYTSVAFMGSSRARDEVEKLARSVWVGTPIDEAYDTAIKMCNALV